MRLKSYTGPNLTHVMNQIRKELGSEALIISTLEDTSGFRITAAVEQPSLPIDLGFSKSDQLTVVETLIHLLDYHRIPSALSEALLMRVEKLDPGILNQGMLSVFSHLFNLTPQNNTTEIPKSILLIGPPGAGKSVTMGKLALEALMKKKRPVIVTLDAHKAGGIQQLETYTQALKLPFYAVKNLEAMASLLATDLKDQQVFLDTTGVNPFDQRDLRYVAEIILMIKVAPLMVLPAAMDLYEALDMIAALKDLGVTRFIHTKVDISSRLTTLLGVLAKESLGLMYLSAGPSLGDRLIDASAQILGKLILDKTHPQSKDLSTSFDKIYGHQGAHR